MAFFNQRLQRIFRSTIRKVSTRVECGHKPFETIPGPKPLPVIGNLWRYLPLIGDYKPDTLFENALFNKERYGSIVREQLTKNHTILHLFDSSDIESLTRQDNRCPHRRSHRALLKYRRDRPDLYQDGGLFPENGEKWYRQRTQFQQSLLSKTQVGANIEKLDAVSLDTIEKIRNLSVGDHVVIPDFDSYLYRWALGNSLAIFLDTNINQMSDELIDEFLAELHNALQALDRTEIQTDKWIKHPDKCPHYKKLIKSQEFLYEFVTKRVHDYKQLGPSYLRTWLLEDRIEKRDVISFVIDSLLAGLHTTSYTAAFLLYHIAKNQSLQTMIRKEVKDKLHANKSITIEQMDRLHLLRNCLKETLRMNPVSIGTGRLVSQDGLVVGGYDIPKGVMIITQNQVISRDSKVYSRPDAFMPDRWDSYRLCSRDKRPSPFATLPFGFGPRSCMGQRLAELQIKVMAARLLQNFELTTVSEIPTKTTLVHNLDGHFEVRFRVLNKNED